MGKRSREKKEQQKATVSVRAPLPKAEPNWPLFALAIAGLLLTGYLTWTAFEGMNVKGCAVGAGCDVVLTSKWSRLLGLPTSFWGFLTYLTLLVSTFMARHESRWRVEWIIAVFGFMYSVYLTTVSLTILHATCPYCLTSLALMTTIFGLTTYQRPSAGPFPLKRIAKIVVPAGVAFILVLHLNYTGLMGDTPVAEDPEARALASYLAEQGVKMYGASWCPHCQEQKEYFGLSASRLPYVECSPEGQGRPQAQICKDMNITTYPTWIIAGKRYEEVMPLQRLSELTGFKLHAANE
jgi:uncharacterized membrane protein/glutaredoxin